MTVYNTNTMHLWIAPLRGLKFLSAAPGKFKLPVTLIGARKMKIDWFLHTPSRDFRAVKLPVAERKFFVRKIRITKDSKSLITDIEINLFDYTLEIGITRRIEEQEGGAWLIL